MSKYLYYYLATPYTLYPGGISSATALAVEQTAFLLSAGIPVFGPIVYGETLKTYMDNDFPWLELDRPFVEQSRGLIVCCAESWKESLGIQKEIGWAKEKSKRIYYMDPNNQSRTILEILSFYPEIFRSKLKLRRRVAIQASYAFQKNLISKDLWKAAILKGFLPLEIIDPLNEFLDKKDLDKAYILA